MDLPVNLPLVAVLSNVYTVEEMLSQKSVNIQERDETHQKTALHRSLQSGRTESLELLLQHGANVNAIDGYGETPTHYAADSVILEVVKLLVGAGADLNIRNDNGELPTEMLRFRPGDILYTKMNCGKRLAASLMSL